MIRFRVDVSDLKRLEKKLARFEDKIKDARPLWNVVYKKLQQHEAKIFSSEMGLVGMSQVPWPTYYETFASVKSADRYVNWKNSKFAGSGHKLLRLSGKLEKSLTKGGKLALTKTSFTFGTLVPYAKHHNKLPGQGRFPPAGRPFLHWNPIMRDMIQVEAEKFIKKRIREVFKNG